MGGLRCVDGSSLKVTPVPARDSSGRPYEVTLELERDGESLGSVGQRCGYLLLQLSLRLAAARDGDDWPDPDGRFPADPAAPESELFALRHRERVDFPGAGELRCTVRTSSVWVPEKPHPVSRGDWRIARRAVIDAWAADGRGVRAVLTSAELSAFLHEVLSEANLLNGATNGRSGR
jgi:hypothetical protein